MPAGLTQQRHRVAIDRHLVPYYGRPAAEPGELRRGAAKAGTPRFHCSATASLLRNGRRLTLALAFVWAEDAVLAVLQELLDRLDRLGIRPKRLFLDRGFASVASFGDLAEQPFLSVVALPKRGKRLQALLTGRQSDRTTYTTSAEDGAITFPLWGARHDAAGRRGTTRPDAAGSRGSSTGPLPCWASRTAPGRYGCWPKSTGRALGSKPATG
ncbi:MAG: hypothetical protein HY718_15405 [Planctomycetes bacterium]|nr:hypothetical protein [Planctomycetota bacterium]